MTEVELINKHLESKGSTLDNKPIYRLVWSEKILENRFGNYREFTDSGLFIREFVGVKLVKKYNYIHERWIFEKWGPGNLTANRETPDAMNGDYIPVYVFEDKKGNYLPPTIKAVDFIVAFLEGKMRSTEMPSEDYLEERETKAIYESLDDHPNWLSTHGEARNGIGYTKGLRNG